MGLNAGNMNEFATIAANVRAATVFARDDMAAAPPVGTLLKHWESAFAPLRPSIDALRAHGVIDGYREHRLIGEITFDVPGDRFGVALDALSAIDGLVDVR
jgi:hypothetical protein